MARMYLRLTRVSESIQGTLGVLKIEEEPFCCTLEPPDRQNAQSISQIPPGQYVCTRFNSPKFGSTWQVSDVHNRTFVLIHPGNVVRETQGCILLGGSFGKLKGDVAVLNSGATFKAFMDLTKDANFLHLTITEHL